MTVSAVEHNIGIACIQEHRYYHSEVKIKYDTGNGWIFIEASAWKNSGNALIGSVGMLLSPHALKSPNNIEKIQPRMMVATFNGNPSTIIISCYNPTNASDKTDPNTFYKELSSLVHSITRHILIIGGDMNSQIGKNDNKFCLHNLSNRWRTSNRFLN